MKKSFFFLCAVVPFFSTSYAQDQYFLNPSQSLVVLNPSFAGSNGGLRNQASLRTTWPGQEGMAFQNSFDAYISKLKAGTALSVAGDDRLGRYKGYNVSLAYAQHIGLLQGRLKLIPSVKVGYGQRVIDERGLVKISAIQPPDPPPYVKNDYLDLGAGLLVNYRDKLYAGISISKLQQSVDFISPYYSLRPGSIIYCSYNAQLSPRSILQLSADYRQSINVTRASLHARLLSFGGLITGVGYMAHDGAIFTLGYRNNYFTVQGSYSFDVRNPEVYYRQVNLAELSASFNLRNKEQRKTLTSFESW